AHLTTEASLYAPAFLCLILSLAYGRNVLTRLLSLPPLVLLGEASYSIYILQVPVHKLYMKLVDPDYPVHGHLTFWPYLIVLVTMSIAALYLIERPAQRLIARIGTTGRALPTAVERDSPQLRGRASEA